MAKVTITGVFKNTENKGVDIEVYAPNPNGYTFRNFYSTSFTKVFDDVLPGKTYFVDMAGHATGGGTFEIVIDGDVESVVSKSYKDLFIPGLKFKVK
ncbi:MAG: hypothetical protein ABI921_02855 [Panacibacter sp.]